MSSLMLSIRAIEKSVIFCGIEIEIDFFQWWRHEDMREELNASILSIILHAQFDTEELQVLDQMRVVEEISVC